MITRERYEQDIIAETEHDTGMTTYRLLHNRKPVWERIVEHEQYDTPEALAEAIHQAVEDQDAKARELINNIEDRPRRRPTREERHQAAADRGYDTWEEYRGER